jgi:hypothetical protein
MGAGAPRLRASSVLAARCQQSRSGPALPAQLGGQLTEASATHRQLRNQSRSALALPPPTVCFAVAQAPIAPSPRRVQVRELQARLAAHHQAAEALARGDAAAAADARREAAGLRARAEGLEEAMALAAGETRALASALADAEAAAAAEREARREAVAAAGGDIAAALERLAGARAAAWELARGAAGAVGAGWEAAAQSAPWPRGADTEGGDGGGGGGDGGDGAPLPALLAAADDLLAGHAALAGAAGAAAEARAEALAQLADERVRGGRRREGVQGLSVGFRGRWAGLRLESSGRSRRRRAACAVLAHPA